MLAATMSNQPQGLLSLGGAPASATLNADLAQLKRLPTSVRDDLWRLLEPNLAAAVDDRAEHAVARFCAEHGVITADLLPVVRSSRLLIRAAAERDVPVEGFAQDLSQLCDDDDCRRALLACYAQAHPRLRAERVLTALGDYGAVLEDARARVDLVAASRHGDMRAVPVVMLTLRYRDGDDVQRLTVQVAPQMMKQLKLTFDALVQLK